MQILNKKSSRPTRSIYMPEASLMGLEGVGVYWFDPVDGTTTKVTNYQPGSHAIQYFEVAAISGEGSWWTGTAPVNMTPLSWNNTAWGGIADLKVSGPGIWTKEGENRMIRHSQLFWWLPASLLRRPNFPVVPSRNDAQISGQFPSEIPGGTPEKPSVETTSDGFLITVPPGNGQTKVTLARQ